MSSGPSLAGTLSGFRRDPLRLLTEMVATHGDLVRLSLRGKSIFLLRGPDAAQHVLVANQDNYSKDSHSLVLRSALGNGLFTADRRTWASHRQLIQPHFAARRIAGYTPATTTSAAKELDGWPTGPVDLYARTTELAIRVSGRTLFGVDFEPHKHRIARAIAVLNEQAGAVALSPLSMLLPSLPGMNRQRAWTVQFRRRRRLASVVADIGRLIDDVMLTGPAGNDGNLLDLLLHTRDETDTLTADDVRDEIFTFLFAGSESVAVTLSWMWHLLARHPQARQAMVAEVDATIGQRPPTAADVDRLPWTRAVLDETMRLYPPVWLMSRTAVADDAFDGERIPAGSLVLISPYLNHRDERWWDQPGTFDPARFLRPAGRPRLTYLPFGAGRRMCVGAGLGIMQSVVLAAMIAQRFEVLDPAPTEVVPVDPRATLRPRGGMPVTLTARAPG